MSALPQKRTSELARIRFGLQRLRPRAKKQGCGMRGIWWRRKSDGALLLQVIPDLPNPAECKADRHRVSDFDNHQQHQSHRYLPLEPMSLGCPSEGYRSVFHTAALVNRAGAGRQQSTHQCIYCPLSVVCLPRQPIFLHWRVITSGHFRIIGSTLPMRLDGESQFGVLAEPRRPSLRICPGNGQADRTSRGSSLAVMTANRERSKSGP